MITYVNEDEKEEGPVNAHDDQTVHRRDDSYSIYECCKNIWHSMYKRACTTSYFIKEVSMEFENKYHEMSQNCTQYAHYFQLLKCAYKCLKINDKNFDSVNVTEKL